MKWPDGTGEQLLYYDYLTRYGATARERSIVRTKQDFERFVVDDPAYQEDCTRNGAPQRFLITRTDSLIRCEITAFPGEELYPGDIIECFGEHWICYQTRVSSDIQVTGTIWLCNHLFRWQNGTPDIIEKWGVLDAGVYSTTIAGGYEVNTPDVQYKIYLPIDSDTERLYVDKRLATNVRYDANGKQILEVYKITRVDPTSQAYGKGAHLMLLHCRSDDYVAEHDSVAQRICNCIPPDTAGPSEPGGTVDGAPAISGRDTLRIGGSRTYSIEPPGMFEPAWSTSPALDGVSLAEEAGEVRVTAEDRPDLIGQSFVLRAEDPSGVHAPLTMTVEVI